MFDGHKEMKWLDGRSFREMVKKNNGKEMRFNASVSSCQTAKLRCYTAGKLPLNFIYNFLRIFRVAYLFTYLFTVHEEQDKIRDDIKWRTSV